MKDIDVRNPRSGKIDYQFTQPDADDLSALIDTIREAQLNWADEGLVPRCEALQALKIELTKHHDPLVEALTLDTGRVNESELELSVLQSTIERWCQLAANILDPGDPIQTSIPFINVGRQLVPYPVTGVISPWNFPLLLSCIDAVPALLAGSAVVVKPSEVTPRFAVPLQACIDNITALKSVFRVIPGDGVLGQSIIDNVDIVCFTGSVATGRKVGDAAAKKFIPAHLELGGKDPVIVTENADLGRAAAAISWGGLANAGQSCLSIERVYVHQSIHDEFATRLSDKVSRLRCNTEDIGHGEIGPIISAEQIAVIHEHLDDAQKKGAQVLTGGEIIQHDGGSWCLPTVLTKTNHEMKVVTEETFGPILPLIVYDTDQEAIKLANDTIYGLSAAVFSKDHEQAYAIADQIHAGAISINDAALTGMMHEGEKQAFKFSGLGGSRMGPASMRRFLRTKALIENTQQCWDPWWFESSQN